MDPRDALVRRAREGDAGAFEQLAGAAEKSLWRLCWQVTGNTEDASDALQETMRRAWQGIGGFRGECSFETWTGRIAMSCCMDLFRRRKARPHESLETLQEGGFDPPAGSPGPEESLLQREERRRLRGCLDALEDRLRIPLILFAVEGWSYERISEVLEVPQGTVKSRISRAREALKKKIREEGNLFPGSASETVKGGQGHVR